MVSKLSQFPGADVYHWSLCSGFGMSSMLLRRLSQFISKLTRSPPFIVRESVAAEMKEDKRKVYESQHSPEVMTKDMKELPNDTALNASQHVSTRGVRARLPWCFLLDAGVPCTSRAGTNNKCETRINCVQDYYHGIIKESKAGSRC